MSANGVETLLAAPSGFLFVINGQIAERNTQDIFPSTGNWR
jgi:hypothetical protein